MKRNKPVLHDPLIINRVKQYLEENVDKTYLDVGVMTKTLMDRYPEYNRRKLAPFRQLVEQAYRVVSQSYGMDSQPGSGDDDSENSDLEFLVDSGSNRNLMNNLMSNLYNKSQTNTSTIKMPEKAAAEPIDILSSDESDENLETTPSSFKKNVAKAAPVVVQKEDTSLPMQNVKKRNDQQVPGGGHIEKKQRFNEYVDNHLNRLPNLRNTQIKLVKSNQSKPREQISNYALFGGNDLPPFPNKFSQPTVGRKFKKEVVLQKSRETFQDIGGMEKTLRELCEMMMHIKYPDTYFMLGLIPPRGILLHGASGCGKTLLARAIAGQLALPLMEVPATEIVGGISGESEERIRDIFEQAMINAPCVLFIDEIDAISGNRSNATKDMERRIVSQMISSLDYLKMNERGQSVLVIGATTRPDALDPALRRIGRFDHEIAIGIPTRKERKEILTIICDGLSMESKIDYDKIAELTPGYVGADLLALVSRAGSIAVNRVCKEQLREYHAKAHRNIQIVDLDDDDNADEAEEDKNKNQKKDGPEQTNDKEEKNSEDAEVNGETAETPTDKPTEDTIADVVSAEPMEVDENAQQKEAEVDNAAVKEVVNDKDAEKEEETVNKSTTQNEELTLFELLNYLDNAPDEINFPQVLHILLEDMLEAVKVVQPSAKREGFITVPDVTWDDVGSLTDIREELKLAILAPVKFPEKLIRLGLTAPSGVLLCGPPGCGKTLLAKAIANEAGINFISVKGPELMNMYVGESERAVRACFQRARNSAPCVIFFDEFDSLCPKRNDSTDGSSSTRVVNQLLTEMDGVEDRQGVYVLAASNRPDIIDPAILRPGRLDTILYVGLPREADRVEILNAATKNRTKPVLSNDVDFEQLAKKTDGYTGADLAGLVRQASMMALKESVNNPTENLDDLCVRAVHFEMAFAQLRPSVSAQDRKMYEKMRIKFAAPRLDTILLDQEVAV